MGELFIIKVLAIHRWYEAKITGWKCTSSAKSLVCSVLAKDTVPDCR